MNDKILINKKNFKITKLQIYHPSPVIVYLDYALFLSMILSDTGNFDWYMNNFIHYYVHLEEKEHIFDFYFPQVIEWQDSLPLRVYKIQDKLFKINKINIIEDIIQWINNGYYVRLELNEKKINGTQIDSDFIHPVFIYGYDLENSIFFSVNFNKEFIYDLINVSFADVEESFHSETTQSLISNTYYTNTNEDASEYLITLYKLKNMKYSFDIIQFVKDINLYIEGTNVSFLYPYLRTPVDKKSFWGINIYKGIIKYLTSRIDKMDYRIFHGLWEHKKIMTARLHYLEEKRIIKSEANFTRRFSAIENIAKKLRILILKYHFTGNKNLIDDALHFTREMYLLEESVFKSLLSEFPDGI